jgi:hypothetical protein
LEQDEKGAREPEFPFDTPSLETPEAFVFEPEEDEDEDVDEDDERNVIIQNVPHPWRSMTVHINEETIVSFELRPDDDTREFLDRAAYLCMAMFGFSKNLTFEEVNGRLRDWLEVEVR